MGFKLNSPIKIDNVPQYEVAFTYDNNKDTEITPEGMYEFGHQIQPVLSETPRCGSGYWRYTIPGHGCMRWRKAFEILEKAGYEGKISIEHEDHYFFDGEDRQKMGLMAGANFLTSC